MGQSITGGFVYRGSSLPATFRGRYFFADYVQGRVWSMVLTINPTTGEATASTPVEHTAELRGSGTIGNISSFGLDAAGELYVVNHTGGSIVPILNGVPDSADQSQDHSELTPKTQNGRVPALFLSRSVPL